MKKRALSFFLAITMLLAFSTYFASAADTTSNTAAASSKSSSSILFQMGNQSAWINGTQTSLLEAPQLLNGRTMVPFRVLAENIGCSVEWLPDTREIVVTQTLAPSNKLKYKLDSADIYKYGASGYEFFYRMDTTPVLSAQGNTLLPARYVAEYFGYNADWADAYSCVVIYPQAASPTDELSLSERKTLIKNIIAPVAPSATVDSFKIDQERYVQNLVAAINNLLSLEGKRSLLLNDDLCKLADFRVMESYKNNFWEVDSYTYGKDWQKLYTKVIGKYYSPNVELHAYSSNNVSNIASYLQTTQDKWNEIKDSKYSYIGIGVVKISGEYTPIIILTGSSVSQTAVQ